MSMVRVRVRVRVRVGLGLGLGLGLGVRVGLRVGVGLRLGLGPGIEFGSRLIRHKRPTPHDDKNKQLQHITQPPNETPTLDWKHQRTQHTTSKTKRPPPNG
jgi:hypothetical protein